MHALAVCRAPKNEEKMKKKKEVRAHAEPNSAVVRFCFLFLLFSFETARTEKAHIETAYNEKAHSATERNNTE